ncbi:transcription initiation factor TFIID subunit 11, partial [Physocladia obscura]
MKANNTNQSDNGNPNANANANDTPDSFGPSSLVLPVCTLLDIDCPPQLQLPIQSETADKTANDDGNKERDNDSLLNSDKDSDSDNDEDDDEEEGDKTIAIEPRSDRERAELQALIDSFDTDQMMRFETFRRSKLSKSAVKKLLTSILGTTTVPQNVLIAMAAIGKLFVGDITEIAREVMHEYDEDDMGGDTALAPHH